MNYFSELGLAVSFKIDLEKLEQLYLQKQFQFHPDKFINKDEQAKIAALEKTILINKAYNVLKSDTERAYHLLELKNVQLDLEENLVDFPEMLSDAFEEREKLSEADSHADLEALLSEAMIKINEYKDSFDSCYQADKLSDASIYYKKILYKQKFISGIKEKMKMLGKVECK